ncbi:MAG: replication initiator protein A [Clostridiales bacterium]|nr:replication initiator protein A [Clostridiales bacterium]
MVKMGGVRMDRDEVPVFPYHYGQEADLYQFYRVPKVLFTEPVFKRLSTDAKILYGLLLDRMQLSIRNGWIDEDGRVFIYYTVESIMEALACGNKKAGQLLTELDDQKGIGLISRKRQGLGKPDKIFVRKCVLPEMSKRHVQTCQNDTSGDVEMTLQDMSKRHANNTDKNNTEFSETESNLSGRAYRPEEENPMDGMEEYNAYRNYFLKQLEFDSLLLDYPYEQDTLNEILELLVETVCSRRKTIRICGEDKPAQIVKSRFMKLDAEHIRYVMQCMHENTTKVRNIKQYLLAALYNAPLTISNYYSTLVNHDMYGAGG